MVATDTQFTGSIPDIYERLMVPMIFQPYAVDMVKRIAALKPKTVLETAAGTGVVTRLLRKTLPNASITATDLNGAMLARAKSTAPADIDWQEANAQELPFKDKTFDCVACQFGVMFFPDKLKGYREARRVLKDGGTFVFNVWGPLAENALVNELDKVFANLFPDNPTNFMARIPHGYYDVAAITAALKAAGFVDVKAEGIDATSVAPSAIDAATAYCQGTPLRSEIENRGHSLDEVTKTVAESFGRIFGRGAISAPIRAYVFEAIGTK